MSHVHGGGVATGLREEGVGHVIGNFVHRVAPEVKVQVGVETELPVGGGGGQGVGAQQ